MYIYISRFISLYSTYIYLFIHVYMGGPWGPPGASFTYTYVHTYVRTYTYICSCLCVCVFLGLICTSVLKRAPGLCNCVTVVPAELVRCAKPPMTCVQLRTYVWAELACFAKPPVCAVLCACMSLSCLSSQPTRSPIRSHSLLTLGRRLAPCLVHGSGQAQAGGGAGTTTPGGRSGRAREVVL
jgi:hypothetical protein